MNVFAINPLILAGAGALAFPLYMIARQRGGVILCAIAIVVVGSFFVLPGGRSMFEAARSLPQRLQRLHCLQQSIAHGAPLDGNAAINSPACTFHGRGFMPSTNRDAAEQRLAELRASLRSKAP